MTVIDSIQLISIACTTSAASGKHAVLPGYRTRSAVSRNICKTFAAAYLTQHLLRLYAVTRLAKGSHVRVVSGCLHTVRHSA